MLILHLSLALVLTLMAIPSTLACGGGGSGGYRKPARPGHAQHSPALSSAENGSAVPQSAPQASSAAPNHPQ